MANSCLNNWSSLTSRLLSKGNSSAWNVLDGNFGDSFVDKLLEELKEANLLEKLLPARTKGEADLESLLSLTGISDLENAYTRGDKSLFISREYRKSSTFAERHPHLDVLIKTISNTILENLNEYIVFDPSLTSIQLATYPGDGKSVYVRHCDRGQDSFTNEDKNSSALERIITAIYYLTESDWDSVLDGGNLRIFSSDAATTSHDVSPYRDRMVVFRADGVEHQVLPSLRRSRTALTLWFYGTPKLSSKTHDEIIQESIIPIRPVDQNMSPDTTNILPFPLISRTSKDTIFVSIASYRDSETQATIENLFQTARYPKRIFVGLVLQNDVHQDRDITLGVHDIVNNKYKGHIRLLELNAEYALGPCYARSLAQSLHREESYVLQIDSHMRFRTNWDDYLLNLWEQTSIQNDHNQKIILTAYPVGYTLPNQIPNETRGTLLVPWKFDKHGMLRQKGRLLISTDDESAIPCLLYAAGFNFGPASSIRTVPYDPNLEYLFFGEELSMAVRLYTHGYDLYAPPETVCFHLWSRSYRPTISQQSSTSSQQTKEEKRDRALDTVRSQLLGRHKEVNQHYGLGGERTSKEYAQALNIDFESQTIGSTATLGGLVPDRFVDVESSLHAEDTLENKISTLDSNAKELIAFFLGGMQSKNTELKS